MQEAVHCAPSLLPFCYARYSTPPELPAVDDDDNNPDFFDCNPNANADVDNNNDEDDDNSNDEDDDIGGTDSDEDGPENLLVTTNLESEEERDDDGMDGDEEDEVSGDQGNGLMFPSLALRPIGSRLSRLQISNMFPRTTHHRKKRLTILDGGQCFHLHRGSIRSRIGALPKFSHICKFVNSYIM